MKKSISIFSSSIIALMLFLNLNVIAQPSIELLQPTDPGIEWTLGASHLISWTDNFQSTTDILLSSDGGTTYPTTLVTGLAGSTWAWNTAGLSVGNNYKIKVQSSASQGYYFDFSANKFALVDETDGAISLIQPTGNENLAQGVPYLISWDDNLTVPVKVELLENDVLKTTISASTTATTLNWTVPSTGITFDSKIYKIKISSTVVGSTTPPAISNKFKIIESSGTDIEVLQPNSGDKWAKETNHLISWNDNLPEGVIIELWDNSTGTWTQVPQDESGFLYSSVSGSTYNWSIPNSVDVGTKYKIKVISSLDEDLYDFSSRFSVTASGGTYVTVLQPVGGDNWAKGTSHLISWNDNLPEDVMIELWNNSTGTWTHVPQSESGLPNTSSPGSTYTWSIPSSVDPHTKYKIKVVSSLDDDINDFSSQFAITATAGSFVTVLQPNGGEVWAQGTEHLISWNDDLPEGVFLELWDYSSGAWVLVPAWQSGLPTSSQAGSTYGWDIPSSVDVGNKFKIKVISSVDSDIKDFSNSKFSIPASAGTFIDVLQPNGGEEWALGTAHLISWNNDFMEGVNLELWDKSTGTWTLISDWQSGITSSPIEGSTYTWNIPSNLADGNKYKIKAYSSLDNNLDDFSDSYFTISASTGTFINVLQPNGGESWARGNSYMISWNDDLFENVDIKIKKGGVITDITDNVSGSSFTWNIPSDYIVGSNYKIKIISSLDPDVYDYSDGNFSITASAGTIVTIQQPNGGENWVRGNDYLISWISDFTEDVDIKLVRGNDVTDIASGVPGSSYTWSIPNGQYLASNYKVKVISTLDAGLYDLSNSNFSIQASSGTTVTVGQPNGGEGLIRGTSYLITWSDDFPENVNIELYSPGATTTISNGVSGSTYTWNIPSDQDLGTNYKVKIYSTLDPTIEDFSNSEFSILASSIMSVYPNPANQNITLNMENNASGVFQVVMYDRFNKAVVETSINTQLSTEITIPTNQLVNGVYFIIVTSDDIRSSKKVIIQH